MPQHDEQVRNRRGCFIILAIFVIMLALLAAFYFRAPSSQRERSVSNGQAPSGDLKPNS